MNRGTSLVTECEDVLFTILGFLGDEHFNLQQRISKTFMYVIRQHFPQREYDTCLKPYCSSLELLLWAIEEGGCPVDLYRSKCVYYGALLGSQDVLEWSRNQQPPLNWGVSTCSAASTGGHMDLLQWLRA